MSAHKLGESLQPQSSSLQGKHSEQKEGCSKTVLRFKCILASGGVRILGPCGTIGNSWHGF